MKKSFFVVGIMSLAVATTSLVFTSSASAAIGQFKLTNNSRSVNWVAYRDLGGTVRRLYPGQNSGNYRTSSVYIPSGCSGVIAVVSPVHENYVSAPGGRYTPIPNSWALQPWASVTVSC